MADVLRFQADRPEQVALKFAAGREVQSNFGSGRDMMYTLVDGRLMFLDPSVAAAVDALRVAPGEPFVITRKAGKAGVKGSVAWDVRRPQAPPPMPQRRAAAVAVLQEAPQLWPEEDNFQPAPAPTNGNAEGPCLTRGAANGHAIKTQLGEALKTAILAASEAEKYAASIQFAVHFEHEDVRAMAISVLIGAQQNGGHR